MADIIHTSGGSDSGGSGLLIGGTILVVIVLLLVFYGLPAIRRATQSSAPMQQAPQTDNGGGTVEIPDEIDVNVNQ